MDDRTLVSAFEKQAGYAFTNPSLLRQALTHSSQVKRGGEHNERMEFLGDRVLALVIAETLYKHESNKKEGEMALRLNTMVRKEACADVARDLGLDDLMRSVSPKIHPKHNIYESQNVLGDACEAVLAAVYLDGGLEAAQKLILSAWKEMLFTDKKARKDPKSTLQEWALGQKLNVPVYTEISRDGPDHSPSFIMSVEVDGNGSATGKAASKRGAEQAAAKKFMKDRKIR